MKAARNFSRVTGWIYLLLAVIGLFERHIFYIFTLPVLTTLLYLALGLSGLTAAHNSSILKVSVYCLVIGIALSSWGIIGTLYPNLFLPAPLPLDNALHLLTGIWGFYGFFMGIWSSRSRKSEVEGAN